MDKFVTFMGYIQSFVVTSRVNESRQRARSTSEKRNHGKNKANLPQEKSRPRAELNITKGSSGSRLNSKAGGSTDAEMEEADGSSATDGIFLRSEVKEVRNPRPKCKMFADNKQPKKFVNDKIDNCRSQAVLPPVDTVSNSCANTARHFDNIGVMAAQRQVSAASPEKLSQSVKKQTSLPSYSAARGLPQDQMTQQKTREDNKGNKDWQRRNDLPDISSTEGKPLVQLRQPSIPRVPIRSKATPVLVTDNLSFDHEGDDWISPQKDQKSRLKLPKLKKKKKEKKGKDFGSSHSSGQAEKDGMAGENESKHSVEKGGKLCNVESKCDVTEAEKLSEEKSVEVGGERQMANGKEQRQQRPRTAFGRWLKKRSNSVAPAPFDDMISDGRHNSSKKAERETGTPEYEEDVVKESMALNGVQMAEELATAEDANCFVQTSQSGVISGSESVSLGVPRDDADRDSKRVDRKDEHSDDTVRSAVGYSSSSVGGLDEKHDGKRKQLITLEMKSGIFEAPTVSKKYYRSAPIKTIFVKQRVERTSALFTEETKRKEEANLCAEKGYDHERFCHEESPPQTARPQINEQPFASSHKKVKFNLESEAACGVSDDSALERPMSSFLRHDRPARKPSTFLQQFQELTNNDCLLAGASHEPPPALPNSKPKWQGTAPCLPAIRPEKKQHRRKKKLQLEDDFESWGEPEPAEVKRSLERPISAKFPRYPAHWDPLLNERPPGRGGQGQCLGGKWKKPERSALSDSPCNERAESPRKGLLVDPPFPGQDQSRVEEPITWCRFTKFSKSFYQNPPRRRATEDNVDIQDVE